MRTLYSLSALSAASALALGLALASAAPARADGHTGGAYAGIEAGLNTLDIASPYDNDFEDGATAFGVYGGWRFGGNFAVEVGYTAGGSEKKNLSFAANADGLEAALEGRYGDPVTTDSRPESPTTGPSDSAITGSTEVQANAITVDGLVFIPVARNLELIGSVGIASWTIEATTTLQQGTATNAYRVSKTIDEDEIGFRLGGGAQYNITDNVSVRGLVRYNTIDVQIVENTDAFDSSLQATAGVAISF